MEQSSTDRRVRKTKKQLRLALMELLAEQSPVRNPAQPVALPAVRGAPRLVKPQPGLSPRGRAQTLAPARGFG